MKEVVDPLVKTPKNLYGKREKHIYWVMVVIKAFLSLEVPVLQPPHEKELLVILSLFKWVNNDNIGQCVNAIN
jgi:hypothetical protein